MKRGLIAGSGPAGLAAACLLANAGVETVVVAPARKPDSRTVALMAPSLRLLEKIGVWTADLQRECAPLKQLHLRDDTGNLLSAPDLFFSAAEQNMEAFGWNIPMEMLLPALETAARRNGVKMIEDEVSSAMSSAGGIIVETKQNGSLSAEFAIAADGRNSTLRQATGISVSAWHIEQSALITRFAHSRDHECVSTEWHKQGGPFTTVPLPGKHSALVWMDTPGKIQSLLELDGNALAREIQLQCHGMLGLVSDVRPPRTFAMSGIKATRFAAKRIYLVGEAAHVFPPVGAQGLNMSLRDVGHMLDVVLANEDAGSDTAMLEYDRLRQPDAIPRQTAISLMNRSLMSNMLPPHLARAAGLAAVALFPPLRNFAITEGLSPSSGLPSSMH